MQAHWDHVAEFARIKHLTGAQVWATAMTLRFLKTEESVILIWAAKRGFVLGQGKGSNYSRWRTHFCRGYFSSCPRTPHAGSASYSTEVIEDGVSYQVAIVNMASRNPGVSLIEKPTYSGIDGLCDDA